MTTDRIAKEVVVDGRVQGVSFRDTCRDEALAAGVCGWVSNEPDGTVRAHFEGTAEAVDRLVAWAGRGPRPADVRTVDVDDVEPEGGSGFEVR